MVTWDARMRVRLCLLGARLGHKPSIERLRFYSDITALWRDCGGTREELIAYLKTMTQK